MKATNRQTGAAYVEILIAVLLISVSLVPALESLSNAARNATLNESAILRQFQINALMEDVLAETFVSLELAATVAGGPQVPTSYSDPAGNTDRRVVYIARYDADDVDSDGDPFTGTDDNLLWVRVETETTGQGIVVLTGP